MCLVSQMETITVMNPDFLPFCEYVTLIGGGKLNAACLEEMLTHAPILVAADGGADRALALGHVPVRVVGDLDSLSQGARDVIGSERLQHISEQDSTDFDKALRSVAAPLVLGVGFTGGRLDHELACYNSLVRHADRACILIGEEDICFHVPDHITLDLPVGMRLSLFPMAGIVARMTGLRWSFEALTLAPWDRVGTSNEVARDRVELWFDRPGMLVIVPRAGLAAVIKALAAG